MTLKELIKMMKSKRLPADRRQFHQLGWFSMLKHAKWVFGGKNQFENQ